MSGSWHILSLTHIFYHYSYNCTKVHESNLMFVFWFDYATLYLPDVSVSINDRYTISVVWIQILKFSYCEKLEKQYLLGIVP